MANAQPATSTGTHLNVAALASRVTLVFARATHQNRSLLNHSAIESVGAAAASPQEGAEIDLVNSPY